MGVVSKGARCDVDGTMRRRGIAIHQHSDDEGSRSINTKRVEEAGLRLAAPGKKAVLCKTHYKEWKKETKDDRALERARYDKF